MEIFFYAFSVMYSPGPVNLMGLNAGLTGQFGRSLGFFAGVGCALFLLLLAFGYTGAALVGEQLLPYLALLGGLYTGYLAYRVYGSTVRLPEATASPAAGQRPLTFGNGFLIQALNPKGLMVVLPMTSVMFPAAQISGPRIALVSALIALGAAGAPAAYSLLGGLLGRRLTQDRYFDLFNRAMAIILALCALFMLYDCLVHLGMAGQVAAPGADHD